MTDPRWFKGRFADRDTEIYERRKSGEKLKLIGESYGIGVERTRMIYNKGKRYTATNAERGLNNGT